MPLNCIIVCTTSTVCQRSLSEKHRKKIAYVHVEGKGFKAISKQFHVSVTPVANIIKKHNRTVVSFSRQSPKRRCNPRLIRRMVWRVGKEPRTTSKGFQAEVEGLCASLSAHAVHHLLNHNGLCGRILKRSETCCLLSRDSVSV